MLDHCHWKKKEMAVTLFYISHHDADKNNLNIFYCHCKIIVQITEKKTLAYVWSYVVLIAVFIYLLIVFVFSCVTFLFFDATETVQRTTYERSCVREELHLVAVKVNCNNTSHNNSWFIYSAVYWQLLQQQCISVSFISQLSCW